MSVAVRPAELALRVTGAQEADRQLMIIKHNLREMNERTNTLSQGAFPKMATGLKNTTTTVVNQAKQLRQLSATMGRYARLVRQLSIGIFVLGMVMRSVRSTTWAVEDAERAYAKALKEHGAGSEEAANAARKLTRARINQNAAMTQAVASTVTYAVSLGLTVIQTWAAVAATNAQAASAVVATGATAGHTSALVSLTAAASAAKIALLGLGPVGWAMLVAGGVTAGVGIYAATRPRERATDVVDVAQSKTSGAKVSLNIENINIRDDGESVNMMLNNLKNRAVIFAEV